MTGGADTGIDRHSHLCNSIAVTLFRLTLQAGESIFDQLVYAAKKAFLSGEFQPGQAFPSVRTLAAEFKIHPNTAHKVIQHLTQERWLEVRPSIGTVVAETPEARPGDKKRLLKQQVEQLVVEARRLELEMDDVVEAIEEQWPKFQKPLEANRR